MKNGVTLDDAVVRNREHPDTFKIPDSDEIDGVKVGDVVKLLFEFGEEGERMWVQVLKKDGHSFSGQLKNTPVMVPLKYDDYIDFESRHVIIIHKM